jgi:lipopolysaccharide export system permease protein
LQVVKKIDIYLVKSFIGPFIAAFFIAIFVLVMQFLWNFIDDIIGKGVSTFEIMELVFYKSLSLFPLALPIAVLLASVMVFGNLAEKYELSSLKSAGVSLLRVMVPVAVLGLLTAYFSLFCSNTLIPLSNLKFYSRLYVIRNQKPALSLEEGVFNDDFKGFTIRIGRKDKDHRKIYDVLIYDQTTSTRRKMNVISAKRGEMYVSDDQNDFVMKLYDGFQYQEIEQSGSGQTYPFARTNFSEWTKYFDLSEFEMGQTEEEFFKSHHKMKSVRQLSFELDTMKTQKANIRDGGLYSFNGILEEQKGDDKGKKAAAVDPSGVISVSAIKMSKKNNRKEKTGTDSSGVASVMVKRVNKSAPLFKVLDTLPENAEWKEVLAAFSKKARLHFITQATSKVKSVRSNNKRHITRLEMLRIRRAEYIYELNFKYSIATIVIIFLFIGAPMGAIVRKGGYGYPLLVAIIFFTLFIVLTLLFDKLSGTMQVNPVLGAWAPCLIMLPISGFLTFKALMDTKMLDIGRVIKVVINWVRRVTVTESKSASNNPV